VLATALSVASFGKERTTNLNASPGLLFLENKGQIHDQNNKPRTDIQFSTASDGMSVFIGNGQIHYQFNKINNPEAFRKPLKAGKTPKHEPVSITSYRMDVSLIGGNIHAPFIADEQQEYMARYYKATGAGGTLQIQKAIEAHSYKKITYKNVYPNIDWVIISKNEQL
jgi:hypothetical protein